MVRLLQRFLLSTLHPAGLPARLGMVGTGPQLPPSRLLIAAADKGRRWGPKFSPAPSNCCPGFSQDLKFCSLLRGTGSIGVGHGDGVWRP